MTAPWSDHRSVPLEVLRDFVRSQAELTSLRAVADDAGIGRSTVHKFVSGGSTPHPRIRRLLALWYMRRLEGVNEVELLRPYVSALDVLIPDLLEPARAWAILHVLAGLETGYADAEQPPPRWVAVFRERLAREGYGLVR